MKLNWGTGIFIVIVIFLAACAIFLFYSVSQRVSLVEEDYYPKELRHEEKLVKMRNASGLTNRITITLDKQNMSIQFPVDFKGKTLTGSMNIYRPSDETLDVVVSISPDTAMRMAIPMQKFVHGKYILKADWVSAGRGYYQETVIFIP